MVWHMSAFHHCLTAAFQLTQTGCGLKSFLRLS